MNEKINRAFQQLISGQLSSEECQRILEELTPEERAELGVILFERMRLASQAIEIVRKMMEE